MELQLTVNDNFFAELTQRLWKNSSDVVRELVQNAYDADASKVIVTFLPNGLTVEDDGGMDPARLRSFLQVGGTHEDVEFTAGGRRVVGKYRVGRLSALGAFSRMMVRTRLNDYHVSFEFSVEDLHRLSQGTVNIHDGGRAPLKRNGTEISLVEQTAETKFDEVMKALVQQPILRTPGFEVYVRRASEFEEWNLEGAERVLPRDIPGIKLEVNIDGPLAITGLVTIAADSALPLSEEDRGIGIVTSSHLVLRSLFGYENSPYRFDRVTGYVDCNQLKTTFGAKDRVVEDQTYRTFHEQMRQFLSRKVVPALKDAELRHIGKLEVKTLRHVDRILGEALVKVASDMLPRQPLSPEAMKALAPTVIKRTKESTVLLIPQGATGASPLPGSGADKEVVVSEVGGAQEILQRSENARPEGERRVGHYLHDVGIAVFIYEDRNDSRPSYNDPSFVIQGVRVKAVFVNKLHPSYARCERTGGLVNHLVTLIAHELVAISDQNNVAAVQLINKIYGTALA